jgi:RNA polymerase sigma-70 factor (ECF subfamily)
MEIGRNARYFEEHRGLMLSIAYRMLGSYSEAQDAVQDAYLRWQKVRLKQVDSPAAYLASIISRLCIDKQRRNKVERMLYRGPWLPEPVDEAIEAQVNDPEFVHEQAESISMAFLLLLEKLPPLERAVFILREAFDLGHEQIASMLDVKTAYSRQLFRRAKKRLEPASEEIQSEPAVHQRLVQEFITAAGSGNLAGLHALMTEDIVAYSDGGGRASAAIIPLVGKERVATVLLHLLNNQTGPLEMEWRRINGEPGIIFWSGEEIHSVHCLAIKEGKMHRIYTMRNPDKLRHLSRFDLDSDESG